MDNKKKSIGAIALILIGLFIAIAMFVLFLNQKKEIDNLNTNLEVLNAQFIVKNSEYESLYQDCLNKTLELEGIDQAAIAAAAKKAKNGQFHLGISYPSLTKAEGRNLLSLLKNEGYNIWYDNEKTADLGNMYYYKNGAEKAYELQDLIYGMFTDRNRFKLNIKSGGSGSGIPAGIRDNTILIKI
jgi:hypothetical protein